VCADVQKEPWIAALWFKNGGKLRLYDGHLQISDTRYGCSKFKFQPLNSIKKIGEFPTFNFVFLEENFSAKKKIFQHANFFFFFWGGEGQ